MQAFRLGPERSRCASSARHFRVHSSLHGRRSLLRAARRAARLILVDTMTGFPWRFGSVAYGLARSFGVIRADHNGHARMIGVQPRVKCGAV